MLFKCCMKSIFVLLLLSVTLLGKEKYEFVSIEHLIEQEVGRLVLPQIYKKLNIDIDILPKPGKRAQAYAVSGKKDGEIMRIWTYGIENTTTIRVPTPYYQLETMAFVRKDSGIIINTKEDLRKYKIIKVRGVKHTNNITAGLSRTKDIDSTEKMMRFLHAKRADVALTNTIDGLLALEKLGYTNIIPMKKPLAQLDLYHYIHEKNKALVVRVNNAILDMKKSGELQKIIKEAEIQVINKQK